jgi:hypothetical protein
MAAAEPAPGYRELLERCWNEWPSKRPSFEEIVKDLQVGVRRTGWMHVLFASCWLFSAPARVCHHCHIC